MSSPGTSLVLGASGQDGSYLVRHLLACGHDVVAAGRTLSIAVPPNWQALGIADNVERRELDYMDAAAVDRLIADVRPDAIHVLSGQTSVGRSFEQPAETIASQAQPILAVLEAVRRQDLDSHVVFASSTDCFGVVEGRGAEGRPFRPQSPYAVGKVAGSLTVRSYRDAYGLRCSTAYLSNHESVLRDANFLFGKILRGIAQILRGDRRTVRTGSLSVERDWGYAPEFAEALAGIARLPQGHEAIVATGRTVLLRDAVADVFAAFDLDPAECLEETTAGATPMVVDRQSWDPSRLRALIGQAPDTGFPELAQRLHEDWAAGARESGG